jgi:class 3 adenylate cyclase
MDTGTLAVLLIFGIPIIAILFNSPLAKALANRISGRTAQDPALLRRLEEMEKRFELRDRAEALARRVTSEETAKLQKQLLPVEGTLTILFSDVEDFTRFVERGDDVAFEILKIHNKIIREQLGRYDGVEVKNYGDGFMIAFPSARKALRCAVDIQRAFQAYNAEYPEDPLRVRMGLNSGEPIKDGEDFIGRTVNLAARIADQARGSEIWVSDTVKNLVGAVRGLQFIDRGSHKLQGFSEPQHLYEVVGVEALESPERRELEERLRELEEKIKGELDSGQ